MASNRVYSFLRLAYSGTRQYVSSSTALPFQKPNVSTDPRYQPPLVNHPTCIDEAAPVNLSMTVMQGAKPNFLVTVSLSQAVTQPVTVVAVVYYLISNGIGGFIAPGGSPFLSCTLTIYPGSTSATGFTNEAQQLQIKLYGYGILSYAPVSINGVTINNVSPIP